MVRLAFLGELVPHPTKGSAALLICAAIVLMGTWTGPLTDWSDSFRPATEAVFHGTSPYVESSYYNPPWVIALLAPFAVLPDSIGEIVLPTCAVSVWIVVALRMGISPGIAGVLLLSPPVLSSIYMGQLEWMLALTAVVPPRWGLFLALAKPQSGLVLALFWLVEAWHKGGWQEVWRASWPVALASVLSVTMFGMWFNAASSLTGPAAPWNMSLWPYSVPIGGVLLIAALRWRAWQPAMAAGVMLSPYAALHSYSAFLLALMTRPRWMVIAIAFLWTLFVVLALA